MKKTFNYLLMAGIITSTACNDPKISLLGTATFTDFPSGSAIEMYDDKLILIGDDATQVLVVDNQYNRLDSVLIDTTNETRIAKDIKPDYEASAILDYQGAPVLFAFGSGSTPKRENALLISLPVFTQSGFIVKDISGLYSQIKDAGVKDLNIEGATVLNNDLVLVSRANQSQPLNTLIILSPSALDSSTETTVHLCNIILPKHKPIVGISGLAYIASDDILLFSASTEETSNAYDDGAIGDSYICIIDSATLKIKNNSVEVQSLINLSTINAQFKNQKIESLAVESVQLIKAIIHLVADNDDGSSRLFKIEMEIKKD